MIKKLLFIFLSISVAFICSNICLAFDYYYIDDNTPPANISIRAGSFLRVVNVRELSTFIADIGDECEFLNKYDMFINEYLAIPENSKLYGVIEDVREPVQGNNAAMKIRITRIETPDERVYYPNAVVQGTNGDYFGGDMTNPAYYKKTPHYIHGFTSGAKGVLQFTPLNIYEYGKHTRIVPGAELHVIFLEDLPIFHS